jgi:photosystem II stability/assembly factor-like uncharacterized protein
VLGVTLLSGQFMRGPGGIFPAGPAPFLQGLCFSIRSLLVLGTLLQLLLFPDRSAVSAQTWQRLGPPGGNVVSLALAADGTVYLGTPDGHVFASQDRGAHWEIRGRAASRLDGVVERIVADSSNRRRLMAAVRFQDPAFGGGVYVSDDAAWHWKLAGLEGKAVRALEQSQSNPRLWVAGTRSGVFRSTDGGALWQLISPADDPELQNVDSLAIDPGNPEVIYTGTFHLPWKTVDGGKSWTSIANGMIDDSDIMSLRIDTENPRRIFSSACSGIYRSDDAGDSWVKLQGIPYASRRTQQIVQDPKSPHRLYAATTAGLWQSSDYGESWKRVTTSESVANAVLVLPGAQGGRILAGMESQGVLLSDDDASSFIASNREFSHRVIVTLAAEPDNPSHLLTRVEGLPGRLLETRDGGVSWAELQGGAPTRSVTQLYGTSLGSRSGWWAALADGGIAQFDAVGRRWRSVDFREAASRNAVARKLRSGPRSIARTRALSPQVESFVELGRKIFVATDNGLWKFESGETEFRRVQAKNIPNSLWFLSATSQNSLLALAGNTAWAGDPTATDWQAMESPGSAGRLLWIREARNGEHLAVLLGTEMGVFLKMPQTGWRLLSNGLPALASGSPAFSGSTWFVSMANGGSYQSDDSGNSWQRLDNDSVQGRVTTLVPENSSKVLVATQSEGLLRYATSSQEIH